MITEHGGVIFHGLRVYRQRWVFLHCVYPTVQSATGYRFKFLNKCDDVYVHDFFITVINFSLSDFLISVLWGSFYKYISSPLKHNCRLIYCFMTKHSIFFKWDHLNLINVWGNQKFFSRFRHLHIQDIMSRQMILLISANSIFLFLIWEIRALHCCFGSVRRSWWSVAFSTSKYVSSYYLQYMLLKFQSNFILKYFVNSQIF